MIQGDLTVGDLVAFMLYTSQIGASIGMMSGLVGSFFVAQGASKRSFQLIDREPKVRVVLTYRMRAHHVLCSSD